MQTEKEWMRVMYEKLNEERKFWKVFVFGFLTFGIYEIIFWWYMIQDLNTACGYMEKTDDDKSPNSLIVILLSIVTFGIYRHVWYYKQGNRMRTVARAYGIQIEEKGSTYVLWNTVGSLLVGCGPLISLYLFIHNVNKICHEYNEARERELNEHADPVSDFGFDDGGINGGSNGGDGGFDQGTIGIRVSKTGTLKCIKGVYKGSDIVLRDGEELVIGRNSKMAQLVIGDSDISRRHCSIRYRASDGYYYVTDYSSLGTVMNNSQKLATNVETRCPVGTKLTLGSGNNEFILE